MPFNQQMNSNLVDTNDTQTKRGIFRSRTHAASSQIVRSKLSSNPIPMKPNRNKFQSKILNRRDLPKESEVKVKISQPFADGVFPSKVVEKPSFRLFEDESLSSESQVDSFASIKDSNVQSQDLVVNSVQSLLFRIDKTTISVSKTLLTNGSSNELDKNTIPCVMSAQQTSQLDASEKKSVHNQAEQRNGTESAFLCDDTNLFHKPSIKKFNTFIKQDLDSCKTTAVMPNSQLSQEISMTLPNNVTSTSTSTVDDFEIGDNIEMKLEHRHTDLLETELKTYHESLKKYDQQAKDVIDQFTESLNEKVEIIKKYEQELSLFNSKVSDLQRQLEESLDRTKKLELTIPKINTNSHHAEDNGANGLKLENEKLKERIKHLETKLAKRDLHIFNLKEVLSLETNKIKELNKAQEEINNLQRGSIEKSREISLLRDELQYATNMRLEMVNEYDEKIVKLKKLLAIREYLLIKGKSQVA